MFRKPKRVAKRAGLRTHSQKRQSDEGAANDDDKNKSGGEDDEDEDEDDDGGGSELEKARKRVRRHKILSSMPLAIGGGGSNGSTSTNERQREDVVAPPSASTGGELSVLAHKHKQNMEQYIAEQIGGGSGVNHSGGQSLSGGIENVNNSGTNNGDEDDLYQQLAREALMRARGAAATSDGNLGEGPAGAVPLQVDEDRGDGGAMLVGSGIAEVILPVQDRLSSIDDSSSGKGGGARNQINRVYRKGTTSSSAVPGGERHEPLLTTAPFRSMVHSSSMRSSASTAAAHTSNKDDINSQGREDSATTSNTDRQGFAAFRGKPPNHYPQHQPPKSQQQSGNVIGNGVGGGSGGYKKTNRDDQMFSNFVHRHFAEKRK